MKRKLPKSWRKYLRQQKAHLRREILDVAEQNKQITKLYEQISPKSKVRAKVRHNR